MLFLVSDAPSFRCRIKNGVYKSAHSFWRGGGGAVWHYNGVYIKSGALASVCVKRIRCFFQTESKPISGLRIRDVFVRYAQSIDFVGGKWRLTTSKRKCVRVCFHDLAKKDDV